MTMDAGRVRRALKAAGLRGPVLHTLFWPLAGRARLRTLLRERCAILEAKNNVLDFLLRTQRPLAELNLSRPQQIPAAARDPQKKRLILAAGASRLMLEDELSARHGSEVGRTLDQALSELASERIILRLPAKEILATHDIYLIVHRRSRPHCDAGELNKLLHEDRSYGAELRLRARRQQITGRSRTYRV